MVTTENKPEVFKYRYDPFGDDLVLLPDEIIRLKISDEFREAFPHEFGIGKNSMSRYFIEGLDFFVGLVGDEEEPTVFPVIKSEDKDFIAKVNFHEYKEFVDDLKRSKIPFTLRSTTFTKKIKTEVLGNYRYSFASGIKMSELYFINKVAKYAETLSNIPIVNTERISYIRKNVFKNRSFSGRGIYEIDLTAAYWSLAYREGFLSRELYEEGLRLSKKIRLVALGALARQVLIMEFDGETFINISKDKMKHTANVFFRVSELTDYYLKTCFLSLANNALFYWVDALFLRGENNFKATCDYLKSNGLEFKYYKIDRVEFKGNKVRVISKDYYERHAEEGLKREFNFEK